MKMNGSKSLHNRIASVVRDVPRSGIRDFFDIVSTRDDIISLSIGEPDFDTPWHVREMSIFSLERGGAATSYTSNLGLLKLREGLAQYAHVFFGLSYDPESEVLVTVGVSEALDLAVRAITNPGDEIIYHEPAFVSYAPVILFAGGKPVCVRTRAENNFKLTRDALEEKITDRTKAVLMNYPNNPTGAVLTAEELEPIADLIRERDLLVITDDIYAELTYEGKHTSIAAMPGMKEHTIFLHGFSKAWAMTGFRMGYACAPNPLIEAMMKIHQYTMMSAPTPSQEAAIEALTLAERDIGEMRESYKQRRNFICKRLYEIGIPYVMPHGAFYVFPDISEFGLSSKDFAMRFIEEYAVAAVPGNAFGEAGEGFIRCAYATGMDDLKEALDRLEAFVGTLR